MNPQSGVPPYYVPPPPGFMPGMPGQTRNSVLWIFCLSGLFLLLAPLSSRGDASGLAYFVKYARLVVSGLIIVIGLARAHPNRLGGVSAVYFSFILFYFFGAAWSSSPAWGFSHKGMLLVTSGAGLMMAHCLHSIYELRRGLRILGVVGAIAGVWVFIQYLRDPGGSVVFDRLAVANMNANSLGQGAACLLVFALYACLSERRVHWRMGGLLSSVLLIWVVFSTGSRGAVLFAGVSLLCLIYPHIKKRFVVVVFLAGFVFLGVNVALLFGSDKHEGNEFVVDDSNPQLGMARLSDELTKNTREQIWLHAWREYKTSPVIGIGWANYQSRSRNIMNVYMQVLLETGMIGAFFFLICLLRIGGRLVKTYRIPFDMVYAQCHFLAVGLAGALLMHGLAESSTLLGTTPNALLMGFALGLIDRLPHLNQDIPGLPAPSPGPGGY